MSIIYTPEYDDGERLRAWNPDIGCLSANMWVPRHLVRNEAALLSIGTVTKELYGGKEETHQMVRIVGDYLVCPRHLFAVWGDHVQDYCVPAVLFDEAVFHDRIQWRNEAQEKAGNALLAADCGMLQLACGKGKTVLALKKIAQRGWATLIVVNLLGLIAQWRDELVDKLGLAPEQIGVVRGKRAAWDKPVVIAMIHTLANRVQDLPEEVKQRFGTIIYDEAHHLPATEFVKTADAFYGARFGLSATIKRQDGLEAITHAHLGPTVYIDLQSDVEAAIYFKELPTEIDLDSVRVREQVCSVAGDVHIGKLRIYMSTLVARNREMLNDCVSLLREGRHILVLVHPSDHPKQLAALAAEDSRFDEFRVATVDHRTKADDRVHTIRAADITFATYGVASEALNAPTLDTLLCFTPFTAWNFIQQSKGRIERDVPGKKRPIVIIYDDSNVHIVRNMCRSLKRQLREHGFTYEKYNGSAGGPVRRVRRLRKMS